MNEIAWKHLQARQETGKNSKNTAFSGGQISPCGIFWGRKISIDFDFKELTNNMQGFWGIYTPRGYRGGGGTPPVVSYQWSATPATKACRWGPRHGQKCPARLEFVHEMIVRRKGEIICKRGAGWELNFYRRYNHSKD
jgi:hypothetical protein